MQRPTIFVIGFVVAFEVARGEIGVHYRTASAQGFSTYFPGVISNRQAGNGMRKAGPLPNMARTGNGYRFTEVSGTTKHFCQRQCLAGKRS